MNYETSSKIAWKSKIKEKKLSGDLVACIMKNGNRRIAERIASKCFAYIKVKEEKDCITFLSQAVRHVRPSLRARQSQSNLSSLASGTSTSSTPIAKGRGRPRKTKMVPLSSTKGTKLAILWITQGARKRSERSMALRTHFELLNARVGKGYDNLRLSNKKI